MRRAFPFGGLILASAGAATVALSLPHFNQPLEMPWRADGLHPIAAAAWSEVNCGVAYALRPGTPRLQDEDLRRMTGAFDSLASKEGKPAACALANARSAEVAVAVEPNRRERVPSTGPVASAQ